MATEKIKRLTLGEAIRYYRRQQHLSQRQLCQKLDVPESTMYNYEYDITLPNVIRAYELAQFFNITVEQLLNTTLPNKNK